jgi:hypothetical protein
MNEEEQRSLKMGGFLVCIVIILSVIVVNSIINKSIIIDDKAYDIIRKAEFNLKTDPLADKKWDTNADLLLKPFLYLFEIKWAIFLACILLLAVTLFFSYKSLDNNYIFAFVLGLSPAFIYVFSNYSDMTISATLLSIFIYLIKKEKYKLSSLVSILLYFFNVYLYLFSVLALATVFLMKKVKIVDIIASVVPLAWVRMDNFGALSYTQKVLQSIFVDFGSLYGISIICLVLGIIGLFAFGKKNKEMIIFSIISVAVLFMNLESGVILLTIALAFFSSKIIMQFIEDKWENEYLKTISIILLFSSLLFTGLSYSNSLLKHRYDPLFYDALGWLNESDSCNGTVLSHPNYGYKIKFFANKTIFMDSEMYYNRENKGKVEDLDLLFKSRRYNETKMILDRWNIACVMITKEMKEGKVWKKDNEGLVFVIGSQKEFFKIYSNNNVEIWKYNESN